MSAAPASATTQQRAAAEAYRALRAAVRFTGVGEGATPLQTALIVDLDRPQASPLAANLVDTFVRAGERCLLIDTTEAAMGGGTGLCELLRGEATLDAAVRTQDGRAVLGPGNGDLDDLIASERMAQVLADAAAAWPHVVIACDPLPQRAVALALAPRVNGVIVTVSSGKTRRPRAVEARESLERVGANLLGVVLLERRRSLLW